MNKPLTPPFLRVALLASLVVPRVAVAAEKQNAFEQEKKMDLEIKGTIPAIDATAGTVTVTHKKKGPMTFSVAKDAMMFVKHKKEAASPADFKVGEEVKLLYRQDGTKLVCHSLWQPGWNPSEKKHKLQKQSQSH
jgi:Cu/Ag efflux protein CusF